jgi:hypothetical protein
MRRLRGKIIIGVALGVLAATTAVAYAANNTTDSHVAFTATPSTGLSSTTFKPGKLFVHTSATDVSPYTGKPGSAENVDLDFPKDFKFFTKYLATCTKAKLTNKTTADAIAACKSSKVGTGSAVASFANPTNTATNRTAVVTAFNGPKDNAGHPTLLLHTRFGSDFNNLTLVLSGSLVPSPNAAYGKRLEVHGICEQASCLAALSDFQTTVQRTWKHKGHKYHYFSDRCSNPGAGWTVQGTFAYQDTNETTDVTTAHQACTH